MSEGSSPPSSSDASRLLTVIAENVASFSAVGLIASVVFSTLFLYAYLSVFDWRLIWIVDYSDIFKVALVTLAVLSSAIILLLGTLQTFLSVANLKEKARKQQIWFLGITTVIAFALVVFLEW